jgi:hypothetical protein
VTSVVIIVYSGELGVVGLVDVSVVLVDVDVVDVSVVLVDVDVVDVSVVLVGEVDPVDVSDVLVGEVDVPLDVPDVDAVDPVVADINKN